MKTFSLLLYTMLVSNFMLTNSGFAQNDHYEARHENPNGTQLVVTYFGAENCAPCHKPENIQAIEDMKVVFSNIADEHNWSFKVVGVALDWSPEIGFKFLKKNGDFDEMIIGNSWGNLAAETHIWQIDDIFAAIPQVVFYIQDVRHGDKGIEFEERYDFQRLSMRELRKWLKEGASWEVLKAID